MTEDVQALIEEAGGHLVAITPGPWVVRAWDRERPWPGERGDRNRYVCSGALIDRRFHVAGGHVATVEWHIDKSEVADADFIAAAPSLVARLVAALKETREERDIARADAQKAYRLGEAAIVRVLKDRVASDITGTTP